LLVQKRPLQIQGFPQRVYRVSPRFLGHFWGFDRAGSRRMQITFLVTGFDVVVRVQEDLYEHKADHVQGKNLEEDGSRPSRLA
jgi:hypothetical protein